ncbi:MAG: sacsin N-terminal ATP-binding-like domain-containing protein [Mycobacteriales bacterium]
MLAAWQASPSRFREDANAEDDLALGGYRDRLLVELAQNASDAAGSDGHLVFRLDGPVLIAANTGTPLDPEGVRALASLRASAKRTGRTVGRFGVGFSAVAAVADEVVVASRTGAVRFSRAETLTAVRALPQLGAELASRDGHVPLLRLPFPADISPPVDADTEVRVRLRPDSVTAVRAQLDALDPTLLLVLPGLSSLDIAGRRMAAVPDGEDLVIDGTRWRIARETGDLGPEMLADRPVEERAQTRWSVTWAVPVDDSGIPQSLPGQVFRAPTPTDDPLSFPALLAATLPLGPDRRRVAPGPLRDAVLTTAAQALVGLLPRLADDPSRLSFVPGPLGAGEVDAALGSAVLRLLRTAPVLAGGRRPADAAVLDGASEDLVVLLSDVLPGLLPAGWGAQQWAAPLRALGVRRIDLAELTELLSGLNRPPTWWHQLYAALPPDRDALGALPVPLTDGRLAPGPRGLLLSDAVVDLTPLGLRVVHPEAAHSLLLRLGAVQAAPRELLGDARVCAAVEAAAVEENPGPIVEAVLALVGAADLRPGEIGWLAALPLPDDEGDWRPAGELLLPHGPLAQVVDRTAGFGVVRQGFAHDDVLAAVGVLRGFATARVEDGVDDVDGVEDWLASLAPGEEPDVVVRDLDLVRADAWPAALEILYHAGLLASSYVRWWLAGAPVLDGRRPRSLRVPGTDPLLVGLYDDAPGDPVRATLLGARTSLADVLADEPEDVPERLADPARTVGRAQLRALHAGLAEADVDPPVQLRAVVDGDLQVVPAEDAVVVDRPDLVARVFPYAVVPVPLALAARLAEVLDIALASDVVPAAEPPHGQPTSWEEIWPGARGRLCRHERLTVRDAGGNGVDVDWVMVGAVDHVSGVEGTARALAWRLGSWERRHELLAHLRGERGDADGDLDPV